MARDKLFGNLAPQNPALLRTTKQQGKSFFKGVFFFFSPGHMPVFFFQGAVLAYQSVIVKKAVFILAIIGGRQGSYINQSSRITFCS